MSFEETIRKLLREEIERATEDIGKRLDAIESRLEGTGKARYLTPEQAAEIVQLTAPTIRQWVKAGRLRRYGSGREMRIKQDELAELMAGGVDEPTENELDLQAAKILKRAGR